MQCNHTSSRNLTLQNWGTARFLQTAPLKCMFCRYFLQSIIFILPFQEITGTTVEQINVVLKVVQEYVKDGKDFCLQNVYISVPDSETLDDIGKRLNSGKGSAKKSKLSSRYRNSICRYMLNLFFISFFLRVGCNLYQS